MSALAPDVTISVSISPHPGFSATDIADAILDILCSVGEDQGALERFDRYVFSVNGTEVVR